MALSYFVSNFTLNTSTGNQAVTGVGFQPKAVVFFFNRATAYSNSTLCSQGFGMTVGTGASQSASVFYLDGGTPPAPYSRYTDTKVFSTVVGAGSLTEEANLVSLDSDGFTVNITSASAALVMSYLCIGGSTTNVSIVPFQSPSSTGNQSYTGAGFTPNTVMLIGTSQTTSPPASPTNGTFVAGVCDSALGQYSASVISINSGGSSNTSRWLRQDSALNLVGATEAQDFRGAITSFDSDGFTINWAATAGSGRFFYALCINGVQSKTKYFTQPLSAGSVAYTGVGFQPKGLVMVSHGATTDGPSTVSKHSFGSASGSSNVRSAAIIAADNVNPANPAQNPSNTVIYSSVVTGGGGPDASTGVTSFDSDGFTLPWGTANASAREIFSLSLGDPAAAAAPKTRTLLGAGT